MKFPSAGKFAERYRRNQGLIDRMPVLSAALLIVIAVLAMLAASAAATTLAVLAFGIAIGSGTMIVLALGIAASELKRRNRKGRKNP